MTETLPQSVTPPVTPTVTERRPPVTPTVTERVKPEKNEEIEIRKKKGDRLESDFKIDVEWTKGQQKKGLG